MAVVEVEWAADTSLPLDAPWPQGSLLEIDRHLWPDRTAGLSFAF